MLNKTYVSYYKTKCKNLLNKAKPLMEIYRAESQGSFNAFMVSNSKLKGKRRRILSSLPIHTISDELLLRILKHNNISNEDIKTITKSVQEQKNLIANILETSILEDKISEISEKDFEKNPPILSLSDSFYENKVYYSYDEYVEHLKLTKEFQKTHSNYKISHNSNIVFKNIKIYFFDDNWIMISKDNSPSIHFVIHHPKLREAIENFIPPVVE